MLDTALKILTEQVLTSRPALERPVTQAKYGLLGAIAAGFITFVALAALGAACCFWLLAQGLDLAPSLAIVGVLLLLAAVLVWQECQRRMQRELIRQEIEAEMRSKAGTPAAGAELIITISGLLQDAAKAFAEGLRSPPEGAPRKRPETDAERDLEDRP
jgi:hypothetical protein